MNRIASLGVLVLSGAMLASPALADDSWSRDRGDSHGGRGRAYGQWHRADGAQLGRVADRLERDTDALARNLDRRLDRSRLDGSRREDRLNAAAEALEQAADRLGRRTDEREHARDAANDVFVAAAELDRMLSHARLDDRTRADFRRVQADLAQLDDFFPRQAQRWDRDDDARHSDRDGWNRDDRDDRDDRGRGDRDRDDGPYDRN